MSYGLGLVLALTVTASLYSSETRMFSSVMSQVQQIDNMMNAGLIMAEEISPGTKALIDKD